MQPVTCTNSIITDCTVDIKCVTESVRHGLVELHIGPCAIIADRHQLERIADAICAWLLTVPEPDPGPRDPDCDVPAAVFPSGYDGH